MKILIAEDEYTTRLMVQVCLERWGYAVDSVADGGAAWNILKEKQVPAIAILDWEMPEIDGLELCRRIKQLERANPIYVILLTARDDTNDIVEGFDAGADDYITKPFNDDELRARIRVAERIVTIQSALNDTLEELRRALDQVNSLDVSTIVCRGCGMLQTGAGAWKWAADLEDGEGGFILSQCPSCAATD